MPILQQVFIQLGSEMSGFSRILMNLGNTINRYSVVFIAVLAVIVIGFFAYNHTAKGAAFLRGLGSHIPAIRRMHHDIASCRFASGMALTLKSGMAPEECLSLVRELNDDEAFQKELTECEQLLENGTDFTAALHQTGIFTGVYARMASIGFKTGSLDQVMSDIAELYQEDLDNRMSNTFTILEPTLSLRSHLLSVSFYCPLCFRSSESCPASKSGGPLMVRFQNQKKAGKTAGFFCPFVFFWSFFCFLSPALIHFRTAPAVIRKKAWSGH